MKIVVASNNPGKVQELAALVDGTGLQFIAQSELGLGGEAAETGLTFVENALLKARQACRESGLPAIADDSGLIVPVLQGASGIYSARYAGPQASAQANVKKLLAELLQVPERGREAFYHCTLVFMEQEQDAVPLICQGEWQGHILLAPRGRGGFGYDPIFGLAENKSAAELTQIEKNSLSHRGKALRLMVTELKKKYKVGN